jgi:hypothetical protein
VGCVMAIGGSVIVVGPGPCRCLSSLLLLGCCVDSGGDVVSHLTNSSYFG